MVNTVETRIENRVGRAAAGPARYVAVYVAIYVAIYVAVTVVTIAALAAMTAAGWSQASAHAWGHAAIVGVFAVVLPLRLAAARRGSRRALRAVGIIALVLTVVNLVEAAIPGVFPVWMRVEMVGIAVLTAALAVSVRRAVR